MSDSSPNLLVNTEANEILVKLFWDWLSKSEHKKLIYWVYRSIVDVVDDIDWRKTSLIDKLIDQVRPEVCLDGDTCGRAVYTPPISKPTRVTSN